MSSVTYSQSVKQTLVANGVEVIGFGQADLQSTTHLLDIIIHDRGVSAQKTAQNVEHKAKLIQQFVDKHTNNIKINSLSPVTVKVIYPTLDNTIDRLELLRQLPNKLPAKITINRERLKNNENEHSQKQVNTQAIIAVSQHILISVSKMSAYQQLFDQLIKIGVSDVQPIDISQQEYQILYQLAFNRALANAKLKAKNIASNMNISLGEINTVQEISIENNAYADKKHLMQESRHNGQKSDQQVVNAQVKLVFAIKPQ
jgi:uncharacterized protein YggE